MIYLDHASDTPLLPQVKQAIKDYIDNNTYGNPSSLHTRGREVKKIIETAREQVANAIHCEPRNIFFTSGSTAGNNWILSQHKHILCSTFEHHSISNYPNVTSQAFAFTSQTFPLIFNTSDFENQQYDLYAHLYVGNETGEIYPIYHIARQCHELNLLILSDMTAAYSHIPINIIDLDVDYATFGAHKYGALNCGVVYIKNPEKIKPLQYGGQQEKGLIAGTESVLNIMTTGIAFEQNNYNPEVDKANKIKRDSFINVIKDIPDMLINTNPYNSISTTVNMSFKGIEGESLALLLSQEGIYVSAGSACNSGSLEPSHVLRAMGIDDDYIFGTIRVSFSNETTEEELITAANAIKKNVNKLRGVR